MSASFMAGLGVGSLSNSDNWCILLTPDKTRAANQLATRVSSLCLFKTPNSTHSVCVVLIVVVLVAIVEVLYPCVVVIVLGRTPIVGTSKTANRKNKGVHINTRLLIFIVELFKTNYLASNNAHFNCSPNSPFIAFKLNLARLHMP